MRRFGWMCLVLGVVAVGGCKKKEPPPGEGAPVIPDDPPDARSSVKTGRESAEAVHGDAVNLAVQTANGHDLRLTRNRTGLSLRVRPPAGVGTQWSLKARILDPDGEVLAAATLGAEAAHDGAVMVELPFVPQAEQWPVLRLEYIFREAGGQYDERALFALTRFREGLAVKVLAPDTLLAGSTAAIRIVVTSPATGKPVAAAEVTVSLGGKDLLTSKTGIDGTVEDAMQVPEDAMGGRLIIVVKKRPVRQEVSINVKIKTETRVLLTTDKPLYQPGQTMHLRMLALRRPSMKPRSQVQATLEVIDPKGNKVFKKVAPTTEQGLAFAPFELASELNLGTYRVRAVIEGAEAERTVEVKRYTLPKFKVSVKTDRPYYLPGSAMVATVESAYFFGRPVAGSVTAMLEAQDVGWSKVSQHDGKTDEHGLWRFEVPIPESLVGQPLAKGHALVRLTAKVTDSAGQDETQSATVPVSSAPLVLDLIVPGGRIVPGVTNELLALVSTPDGRPSAGTLVSARYGDAPAQKETTNALGVAVFAIQGGAEREVLLSASTTSGESAQRAVPVQLGEGEVQVLLSIDTPSLRVGDLLKATVRATGGLDRVFIDLIRDGQGIVTSTVELKDGVGTFELLMAPDHAGTLLVQAYQIGRDMTLLRDARPIVVVDARDLLVKVDEPAGKTWRPGDEASLHLQVQDAAGKPAAGAALGVQIVDEALFALADERPGLERAFFAIDQELLKPKIEVGTLTASDVLAPDTETRQSAAQVLSAAATATWTPAITVDSFKRDADVIHKAFEGRIEKDAESIWSAFKDLDDDVTPKQLAKRVWKELEVEDGLADPWGNAYRLDVPEGVEEVREFTVRSSGPDEIMDTGDDLTLSTSVFMERERKVREEAMPRPVMMAPVPSGASGNAPGNAPAGPATRVRQHFPETLYVNPLILTDDAGRAEVRVEMADSITTWRLSAFASDAEGRLGSATAGVVVFQDFFVDLDLPESVTQNDEIAIPVAVYNYRKRDDAVALTLNGEGAFERLDGQEPIVVTLAAGEVKGATFRIKALQAGTHPLTLDARASESADAVKRTVRVIPDGTEVVFTKSGGLDGAVSVDLDIPKDAIDGGTTLLVKLYPGSFSQVVEGLDAMLRMPSGCFEQTSSTTYPNLLVLDYFRRQKRSLPEVEVKALSYINQGWQRLLTFEVPGGGFSWFGQEPANRVLTAFGVQEFADMAKVYDIDPAVLERTRAWLVKSQEPDGSWKPDAAYLHQENWGDVQSGSFLVTAYIARALALSGYKGDGLGKALDWLKSRWGERKDAYSLALVGGALAEIEPTGTATGQVLDALAALAERSPDQKLAHFGAGVRTAVYGDGLTASIETTAMAALAFMRSKRHMELVTPALSWLVQAKDEAGTWHATMPTILALSALVAAITESTSESELKVTVNLDGKSVQEWLLASANSDVLNIADLSKAATPGKHTVELVPAGQGTPLWQVSSSHWVPRGTTPPPVPPAFDMTVDYDKSKLAQDEVVTATATVTSRLEAAAHMLVLDLAIPPGFEAMLQDLDDAVAKKTIARYRLGGRQLIVYLEEVAPRGTFALTYRLRAKTSVKASTGVSRVYEYYEPAQEGRSAPKVMVVE